MKHFKLSLIVTAIVLPAMIIGVVISFVWLNSLSISNREKAARAEKLGTGIATLGCVVMAPFWLVSAANLGKERRKRMAGN
jgi:hypothetical protein